MLRISPIARAGTAVVGVAGALTLAACSGGSGSSESGESSTDVSYSDGTYTAEGSYATPETVETITVTLTLAEDVVTDVEVSGDPQRPESEQYQGQFIEGIADEVVGRDVDEISVSRVAGSSLTSGGFAEALESIKAEALDGA